MLNSFKSKNLHSDNEKTKESRHLSCIFLKKMKNNGKIEKGNKDDMVHKGKIICSLEADATCLGTTVIDDFTFRARYSTCHMFSNGAHKIGFY